MEFPKTIIRSPYTLYSIYLRGTIARSLFRILQAFAGLWRGLIGIGSNQRHLCNPGSGRFRLVQFYRFYTFFVFAPSRLCGAELGVLCSTSDIIASQETLPRSRTAPGKNDCFRLEGFLDLVCFLC